MRVRVVTWIGGVLTIAAVLVGCGSAPAAPPAPGSAGSSTPTTSSSPSAPASPVPPAADGTNLDACRDGRCEVVVRSGTVIPLDPSFGVARLLVARVGDGSAKLEQTEEGGSGMNTASGGEGSTITTDGLTVTVESVSGDAAVVSLHPSS